MTADVRPRVRRPYRAAAGSLTCGLLAAGLLAGGCTGGGGAKSSSAKSKVDHTVAGTAAPPLTDTGPKQGVLKTAWTIEIPRSTPHAPALRTIAAGQVLMADQQGLDAYDATTGRPRWHYYEQGRLLLGSAVTGGAIILRTQAEKPSREPPGRWVGLDAGTGRLLWTTPISWESYDPAGGARDGLLVGGGVVPVRDGGPGAISGLDARTGQRRWTTVTREGCEWHNNTRPADTDGSLFLFVEQCATRTPRVRALAPETGKERWAREVHGHSDLSVTVRGAVTALMQPSRKKSVLIAANGREFRKQDCFSLCARPLLASAGRVFLLTPSEDRSGDLVTAVDPRTGKKIRGFEYSSGTYSSRTPAQTAAGGRFYGVREELAERLLPAGLDVADPDTGEVRRMPLPVELSGRYRSFPDLPVADIKIAGGRVYLTRSVGRRLVMSAMVAAPAGDGPVELGGVPEADWPDACELAPGHRVVGDEGGATIGPVKLPNVRCRYEIEGLNPIVTLAWVAATAEQAKALLAAQRPKAKAVEAGDDAYYFDYPGPFVMRVGRFIVSFNRFAGTDGRGVDESTALAKAIAETLRRQ